MPRSLAASVANNREYAATTFVYTLLLPKAYCVHSNIHPPPPQTITSTNQKSSEGDLRISHSFQNAVRRAPRAGCANLIRGNDTVDVVCEAISAQSHSARPKVRDTGHQKVALLSQPARVLCLVEILTHCKSNIAADVLFELPCLCP